MSAWDARSQGLAQLAMIAAMGAALGGQTTAQRFPVEVEKTLTPEEIERIKRHAAERIESAKVKRERKARAREAKRAELVALRKGQT